VSGDPALPVHVLGSPADTEGAAGEILNRALAAASWNRNDLCVFDTNRGAVAYYEHVARWKPKLTVALGEPALRMAVGADLPPIRECRGYLWDAPNGSRVLASMSPADIVTEWVPWRALMELDIKKARRELKLGCPPLPERKVIVLTGPHDLDGFYRALELAPRLALDIENTRDLQLSCLGVGVNTTMAFVIPAQEPWQMALIREVCESKTPKVFQNGAYDRYFLDKQNGVVVRNHTFDTILAWHALQPELAGKAVEKRKGSFSRKTVKSLKFLSSIYTRDAWWKSYDFANEMERYTLCGRDCCITLEIADIMEKQLATT
jgi:hypothetical protein